MKHRRIASFVDDVVSDRRPRRFKADPVEAEMLRAAITMRAARPGEGAPEEQFVARLHNELALEARKTEAPRVRRAVPPRRARLMLGAVAAVTALGGTVAATTTVDHVLAASSAHRATNVQPLRIGRFESTDGHVVGEVVAFRGDPSWVFMSIRDPNVNGLVSCQIQLDNGRTAAAGTFVVRNGTGEWARTLSVDISQLRGATLVTSTNSSLATASFPRI